MTKVAALVGPTAVGKTAVSIDVARRLSAEIVSVDSMQIYLEMDIGTDKPGRDMRSLAPHHLIDLKSPSQELTVAEFREHARRAIESISSRGRLPLLVGGSGLYFRAVVDDLRFPPRSLEVRKRLEEEAERVGPGVLHERLRRLDAQAAARIEPTNARRTIRALEAIEITGRPFSEHEAWERYESIYDLAAAGLELPRQALSGRIAQRVDDMLEKGLIQEAKALDKRGLSHTARQALGYRQVLDLGDDATRPAVQEAIVRATKRYARRQESWFKADPRITWFEADRPDVVETLVSYFTKSLRLP